MDNNDDDENYNSNSNPVNHGPFPDNCPNEIVGIESLQKCFADRYDACPGFFIGSLQQACEEAFNSPITTEHCPILIYIHHDKTLFSHIFCSKIFCSEKIIEYLLDNKYIVWPWDITFESNRNTLKNVWKDIFPNENSLDFSEKQCPMLIGIIRRSKYECIPLLKGDALAHSPNKFSSEAILKELSLFKKEFDDIEQALACEFFKKSGISWDVMNEICKYLSLNDAVNAFSNNILSFLRQSKAKLHITDTSDTFLCTINQKIKPEQIVSLYLNTDDSCLQTVSNFLPVFNRVVSLTLINLHVFEQIGEYQIYFPNLSCLSLRYNNEIGFNILTNIFHYLPHTIKRLKIHCTGALCTHYDDDINNIPFAFNLSVKYFLLDMGQSYLNPTNECCKHYESCFLITTINLMRCIPNIHYFHLILNQCGVDQILNIDDWGRLMNIFYHLKKITLHVIGNNKLLLQKLMELQDALHYRRNLIKFRVIFTKI